MKGAMMMSEEKFFTAQEVALIFFEGKVTYQRVLAMARKGDIPCRKIGRRYLFDRQALDVWRQRNLSRPAFSRIKLC